MRSIRKSFAGFSLNRLSADEVEDRNGNGIIDSIEDTLDIDIIDGLAEKGYTYPGVS